MTTNRDKQLDRSKTRGLAAAASDDEVGYNWLGHEMGSGAAQIDALLLVGAPMKTLEAARGGVQEHIRHLAVEHDFLVRECEGIFRFDFRREHGLIPDRPAGEQVS
jgi:hypothetical protein